MLKILNLCGLSEWYEWICWDVSKSSFVLKPTEVYVRKYLEQAFSYGEALSYPLDSMDDIKRFFDLARNLDQYFWIVATTLSSQQLSERKTLSKVEVEIIEMKPAIFFKRYTDLDGAWIKDNLNKKGIPFQDQVNDWLDTSTGFSKFEDNGGLVPKRHPRIFVAGEPLIKDPGLFVFKNEFSRDEIVF